MGDFRCVCLAGRRENCGLQLAANGQKWSFKKQPLCRNSSKLVNLLNNCYACTATLVEINNG
ncbi:hypothetical protein CV_0845 [Chromobacterium violaceum ATCC 12472]|uniref:Uncharacterized protein n=1 Tax=Chromobacterium violaceum (strain ATCC 12472 / DSM 30191 / JCM 1249 / CCUG 213 / NBRC 12614 / NCIMB 9131 / NCTC 9757 / MK) TaxID=243365 RepID=Q7NZS6_CHRVO|nr:hypothetical protein CV_0845 [Chromobacterium violaceum ATCC 12472]